MKIIIESTCIPKDNPEKLIHEYPCLNDFGFEVEEKEVRSRHWITDENGKLIWQISDKTQRCSYINIDTIEQLMDLLKALALYDEHEIVVGSDYIEIYDGYRE